MPRIVEDWLMIIYVVFSFCTALCFGALKSVLVGPIAALIMIFGNVGVILGLLPAHVSWTVYTLLKTERFDALLKVALMLVLPALFGIWVGLSIAGSVLVGVGYGFFTQWVSAFEAFRHDYDNEFKKFFHCIVAHSLQLEAFSLAIKNLDEDLPKPKLQFVGSCRNEADETRLHNLKDQAIELKVDEHVEFFKNGMYRDLVRLLGGAVTGIHSMIDEHFGISVVEYMAAGAIPIGMHCTYVPIIYYILH